MSAQIETGTLFTPEEISGGEFGHSPLATISSDENHSPASVRTESRTIYQADGQVFEESLIQLSLGLDVSRRASFAHKPSKRPYIGQTIPGRTE